MFISIKKFLETLNQYISKCWCMWQFSCFDQLINNDNQLFLIWYCIQQLAAINIPCSCNLIRHLLSFKGKYQSMTPLVTHRELSIFCILGCATISMWSVWSKCTACIIKLLKVCVATGLKNDNFPFHYFLIDSLELSTPLATTTCSSTKANLLSHLGGERWRFWQILPWCWFDHLGSNEPSGFFS